MESRNVNGRRIFAPLSREELIEFALANNYMLVAVNAEKILSDDQATIAIINGNVGYPDGVGAVWCLRQKGVPNPVKIPGCELWLDIVRAYQEDKTFYMIGGTDEVIERTVNKLRRDFPAIQIVGYRNGYIKDQFERDIVMDDVVNKSPDVVFVAMGSPRQELLMQEMQKKHAALYQGLGGSFDVYIGNIRRAPRYFVDKNLEWAYRLMQEPSRIWRQVRLIKFLFRFIVGRF